MAQKTYIDIEFLRPGMIVAEDIYRRNTLLISANTPLTFSLIYNLQQNSIRHVQIYLEQNEPIKNLEEMYKLTLALVKKFLLDFTEFRTIDVEILNHIVQQVSHHQNKIHLFELASLLEEKDECTYNHSLSVALLTLLLGEWVGYEPHDDLILAGLLHDVGKLNIPENILDKPGSLTQLEWEAIKKHPQDGSRFLRKSDQFSQQVIHGALYHHERQDGSGYPCGLKGDEIPSLARIISICDVFDAMTSRRPYKKGEDVFRVLKYLYSCKSLFDWRYLEPFVMNMLELLIGEDVILSSGQTGKLVFINRFSPFQPLVKVDTTFLDLSKDTSINIEAITLKHCQSV